MLKIIGLVFFLITFTLLVDDSLFNPASSLKYFLIDSRFLYLVFILVHILFVFLNVRFLPNWFVKINNYFLFPVTTLIFLTLAILNGFTQQFFVFNTFGVNLENFKYLFFISGFVLLANIQADWLKTLPQKLLYFGGILYIVFFSFIDVISPKLYDTIIKEDGLLENIQVLFYSIASLVSLICSLKFFNKFRKPEAIFFLVLSIGLLFIAGEEISWGQRIFGIETPESFARMNLQEETTIHNLGFFQSKIDYVYMAIGLWGAFSAMTLKSFLPKLYQKYQSLFPLPILFIYFFAVTRFYFLNKFVVFNYQLFSFEKIGVGSRQEISETLLAFGFAMFAILTFNAIKHIKKDSHQHQ